MKNQSAILWIVISVCVLVALLIAGRLILSVLGVALAIFMIGMLVSPERTKAYALRVIKAMREVIAGISGSGQDSSSPDGQPKDSADRR